MKAIVYNESVALGSPDALDLLVEVHSVSVNPVDTRIRGGVLPPPAVPKVLGWDASGAGRAVGDKVTLFKPGERVMYAGSLLRAGTNSELHLVDIAAMLAPQGKLGLIDDPVSLDVPILKPKSISLHWELMYTRSMYQTRDMIEQHNILVRVAGLVDAGVMRTTLADHFGTINAANLRRAHALLESGKARGKIVLSGF
jgi:NADPH:quinone reductase-like Zn-dependent oxidoreductase